MDERIEQRDLQEQDAETVDAHVADDAAVNAALAEAEAAMPRPPALSFLVDETSGDLQARFDPDSAQPVPNIGVIKEALAEAGFGDMHRDDGAIHDFISHARSTKEPLVWIIGKRRDAEFFLTVDEGFLCARLTLVRAEGGKPISLVAINGALRERGINYGLAHLEIDAALAAGECENLVIAKGQFPEEGTPARFISLLEEKRQQLSEVDESAVIKFADLSHLLLVNPGDKLMRRIAPIPGKNGIDIRGQVAFPTALPELTFGEGFAGAAPDKDDPDLLLATIDGQPVLVENGVTVNRVIHVADVDLSTGNIDFDGTVHIDGDVIAGMIIKVTGDVIITGTLEAAHITAGGNVSVGCGIIGHADTRPGHNALPADTARVRCKGSVQAMFVEHAHIEAGDSILIERSVCQCELIALNDIMVGKHGSKFSHIIGGITQAKHLIKASVVGASSGVKTRLVVGSDPFLDDEITVKNKIIRGKMDEVDKLLKLILFLSQNPKKNVGGLGNKVNATRAQLLGDIEVVNAEIAVLKAREGLDEDARIAVDKTVHYGLEVQIGTQVWHARDDMGGTILGMQDGQIMTGLEMVKKAETESEKTLTGAKGWG